MLAVTGRRPPPGTPRAWLPTGAAGPGLRFPGHPRPGPLSGHFQTATGPAGFVCFPSLLQGGFALFGWLLHDAQ